MSVIESGNGASASRIEEIRASELRAAELRKNPPKKTLMQRLFGSSPKKPNSIEHGAKTTAGKAITNAAQVAGAVGRRATFLQSTLGDDFNVSDTVDYPGAMRRFDKLQSQAGLTNLLISGPRGFPSMRLVTTNPYTRLQEREPYSQELRLIEARKSEFAELTNKNVFEGSRLQDLDSKLQFMQVQAIGEEFKSKISAVREQITKLAERALNPAILAEQTSVEIKFNRGAYSHELNDEFCRFSRIDRDYQACEHIIHIQANPYTCAQLSPDVQAQNKTELKTILRQSWTLSKSIAALSKGHANMPAITKGVEDLQKSVLAILRRSDQLLYNELKQIQSPTPKS